MSLLSTLTNLAEGIHRAEQRLRAAVGLPDAPALPTSAFDAVGRLEAAAKEAEAAVAGRLGLPAGESAVRQVEAGPARRYLAEGANGHAPAPVPPRVIVGTAEAEALAEVAEAGALSAGQVADPEAPTVAVAGRPALPTVSERNGSSATLPAVEKRAAAEAQVEDESRPAVGVGGRATKARRKK